MKHNNPIKINNGLKKIYLLNIKDFVRMISHIKNNWNKYKNNSLFSKYEGPFLLKNISKKITIQYPKYNGLSIKCNFINEKKIYPNINFKLKNKFSNFLKNGK